jgi:hypothetical protein
VQAEFEETAVTRIFGCKLRSCLKSRGAKQSITQELFNALPLDISIPQIRSLDDALLGFMSAVLAPLPVHSRTGLEAFFLVRRLMRACT